MTVESKVRTAAEDVVGGVVIAMFAGISFLAWPTTILCAAVWLSASHAILGNLLSFRLGEYEIHPSGLANVAVLCSAAVFILFNYRESRPVITRNFRFFSLLVAFSILRIVDAPDKGFAIKEVLLLTAPLAVGIVAAISFRRGLDDRSIQRQLLVSPLLIFATLIFQAFLGTAGYDEYGLDSSLGKGPIAIFGLPILALALSFARYEQKRRWPILAVALSLGLILLTVERMASAIALLVLIPLRFVKVARGSVRNAMTWSALAAIAAVLSLQVPTVRYRFLEHKEDSGVTQEDNVINTSGRAVIWLVTVEDALQKPFIGHGTASAELLTRSRLEIDHPHNEYLRIWHDLGVVGVVLLLLAWCGRLLRHLKLWWSLDDRPSLARPQMAAALVSLAFLLSFLTDSTLLFTPAMIPAFLMFAAADVSGA